MATFSVSDGTVRVNGTPFFPFGVRVPVEQVYDAWATLGSALQEIANTFVFEGNLLATQGSVESYLNDMGSGQYAILDPDLFQNVHDCSLEDGHPATGTGGTTWHKNWFATVRSYGSFADHMLAWWLTDEANNLDQGDWASCEASKVAPAHATWAMDTETTPLVQFGLHAFESNSDWTTYLKPKANMVTINRYSTSYWRTPNAIEWANNYRDAGSGSIANIPFVQGYATDYPVSDYRLNSYDERRYLLYTSIVHGARGIIFYAELVEVAPNAWAYRINTTAIGSVYDEWTSTSIIPNDNKTMEDVLFATFQSCSAESGTWVASQYDSGTNTSGQTWAYGSNLTEDVQVLGRSIIGYGPATYYFFFAVNDAGVVRNGVKIYVPEALNGKTGTRLFESGTVGPVEYDPDAGYYFTDNFGSYRAHVYRFSSA